MKKTRRQRREARRYRGFASYGEYLEMTLLRPMRRLVYSKDKVNLCRADVNQVQAMINAIETIERNSAFRRNGK